MKIQPFAFIPEGVTLGDDVFVGPGVTFANDKYPPSGGAHWRETVVEAGASLGASVTVLPGVRIGAGARVGAGAIVTKDIPAGELWVGSPARRVGSKWAVFGLGFISPRHLRAIEKVGGKVLLTCDPAPSKCADHTDWRDVLADPVWREVTHVAMLTPNDLHYEMCEAMTDKVVLCEKPLGIACDRLPSRAYTVLQLRHHPEVVRLKTGPFSNHRDARLTVRVKRDPTYWHSWKGSEARSGGILFNLGIHYFDLALYLFGGPVVVHEACYTQTKATGCFTAGETTVRYDLEIMDTDEGQERSLVIDGEEVSLSKQDNLSFEDLHVNVYESLLHGNGVTVTEATKSIQLVEALRRAG